MQHEPRILPIGVLLDNLATSSAMRTSDAARLLIALCTRQILELVPKELVVDFVMELDFLGFHESPQQLRAAIGGSLL